MDKQNSAEPMYSPSGANQDDSFYDSIGETATSPEYDNTINTSEPSAPLDPEAQRQQEEVWRNELAKLEDEIMTLRQVLSAKVRQSGELKRKLGITAMVELKQDLRQGITNIRDSDAYQKTNQTLKTVGQRTSSAFSSFGAFTSKKIGDMRNSNAFKSIEEKVGGAVSNVKQSRSIGNIKSKMSRVRSSRSESNFEDALNSMGSADAASAPTTPTCDTVHPL